MGQAKRRKQAGELPRALKTRAILLKVTMRDGRPVGASAESLGSTQEVNEQLLAAFAVFNIGIQQSAKSLATEAVAMLEQPTDRDRMVAMSVLAGVGRMWQANLKAQRIEVQTIND